MSGIINSNIKWGNQIKILLKRLLGKNPYYFQSSDERSEIVNKASQNHISTISAKNYSRVVIEENVILKNVSIHAGKNSQIIIKAGCKIQNTIIESTNESFISIGKESIVGAYYSHPTRILADCGRIDIKEKNKLLLERIFCKFGGSLSIGKYSGFGYFTDIRCDEKISLGEYTLCSYNVSIYDSNVHSTDWKVRRDNIEKQFPGGLTDIDKPETGPIELGNDVWIGRNAAIMKSCKVADKSIIGTGCVLANIDKTETHTFVSPKARIL